MDEFKTTKKAKKQVDAMTMKVFNSLGMASNNAKVSKSPDEAKARYERQQMKKEDAANAIYEKLIRQGKVTPANRNEIKKRIAAKTGVYVTTDAD